MINEIRNIPITESSYPLTRASEKCDFSRRGYVEREYFLYGTANVYTGKDGTPEIKFADAPYCNRILVRAPAEPAKASGRVAIEILNATSGLDIDRTWILCKEQMMRQGDVYIGITSKPSSLRPLRKYDPARYGELYWSNPNPQRLPQALIVPTLSSGAYEQESEMGLFWDMLTDLVQAVRRGGDFLNGIQAKWVYLIGWSQSCGYMIRYVNNFADGVGKRVFDGYFAAGGVRKLTPPLNQYELGSLPGEPGNQIQRTLVPYIFMQTESENLGIEATENWDTRLPDSDGPHAWIRNYDIPGATHDTQYTMLDYYGEAEDEFRAGILLEYPGEEFYPNDYPYELAFSAGYAHLCAWAEKEIAPPRIPPIRHDFSMRNLRDCYGNAMGGWRLPPIDLPVCTYYPSCTQLIPSGPARRSIFGYRIPLERGLLQEKYGTLAAYEALVRRQAEACVQAGTLLRADVDACVGYCVAEAQTFGLN